MATKKKMKKDEGIWSIGRKDVNRNGSTYWKGVLRLGSRRLGFTIYPSSDGNTCKLSVWENRMY